jgi:segregation and condensation protein B
MLGERANDGERQTAGCSSQPLGSASQPYGSINPRSIVEAILFVGRPDNSTFSARELAAMMRGVSPSEVEQIVGELNAVYERDEAPYRIEGTSNGYRLVLIPEFQRMRDKFYGRVREAKLSPAALEVLSIIAYKQPVTAEEISELRGAPNAAALATLVRRRLVRLERSTEPGGQPCYWTTERFLKLFGLDNLSALPRSEELDKV